jgi:hypothetical protein
MIYIVGVPCFLYLWCKTGLSLGQVLAGGNPFGPNL